MLPFVEEGGDPIDAEQMMIDVGGYRWDDYYCYNWHSLIPFKNILSSRDLFPLFEKSAFAKKLHI